MFKTICNCANAKPRHICCQLCGCFPFSHNHHHLTPYLDTDSVNHQVYTRDWESSTTANQDAPQAT